MFRITENAQKTTLIAVISAVIIYVSCWFTQIEGIDTVTILGILLVVSLLEKHDFNFLVLIPLAFVNEKIVIIMFLFLLIRCSTSMVDFKRLRIKLVIAGSAMLVYFGAIVLIHAKGNAYQLTPLGYLPNFINNVLVNLSLKGILLSWAPSFLLLGLVLMARYEEPSGVFSRRDIILIPTLMVVALTLTEDFQVGRIVMMSIPFFAMPIAEQISRWILLS